jgi:hypothetical protein
MLPDFNVRGKRNEANVSEGLGIGARINLKLGVEYLENGIVVKKSDKRAQDYDVAS